MKESISALMDGELHGADTARAVDALRVEGEARDTWRTYHLIGDALRDTPSLSPAFAARVQERLEKEPTVLAPRRLRAEEPAPRAWYALPAAAAASAAGVAVVAWLAFAPQQGPVQVATTPVPVAQPQQPAVQSVPAAAVAQVPLPSGTPDYLLAHQGYSPRVSLQGMAPYARSVSAETSQGRR
jgi:sigma-E factor negative regulatory protein RseA